nr:ADP-ribosylglycohydrolase family protein [Pseudonocardia sp. H11422]
MDAMVVTLGGDSHRPVNVGQVLARLGEIARPAFVHPLELVRQLAHDATPAAAAEVLGTGGGGAVEAVPAALLAFLRSPDDPVECVHFAIRIGGHTVLDALRRYEGAVVLVTHDPGAVEALAPERVILLPDGTEDHFSSDHLDLVTLA